VQQVWDINCIHKVMSVDAIWLVVDKYFKDLHTTEQGTNYLDSDCFKADEQDIARVRQSSTARNRKATQGDHNVNANPNKCNLHKKMITKRELITYEKDHIFCIDIGNSGKYEVRCKCKTKGKFGVLVITFCVHN
jgi:hypothetical protein